MTLRKRNGIGKSLALGLCVTAMGCWAASASADTFTWHPASGPGGDWNDAANWYNNGTPATHAPTVADDVNTDVSGGSTSSDPIVIDAPAFANNFTLSYGHSAYLQINDDLTVADHFQVGGKYDAAAVQTGGTVSAVSFALASRQADATYTITSAAAVLNISGELTMGRSDAGAASAFNQQAGTVTVGEIANTSTGGATYTGTSDYNLSGGTLTVTGSMHMGWKNVGWTSFNQSAGTSTFASMSLGADFNNVGYGRAVYSQAAQATVTGDTQLGGGSADDGGYGEIVLDGSKTGTGTDLNLQGDLQLTDRGTLKGVIDAAAIATPIAMRLVDVGGDVTFDAGALLDVGFAGGATPTAGTWTLLTTSGVLTDSGLTFASGVDTSHWSFNVSDSAVTVTYAIPEPTSGALALLGLGGVLMLPRRRRCETVTG